MTTPAKKTNGAKAITLICPHADVCAAPGQHSEIMANVDQVAAGVGLLLEETETKGRHLNALTEQMSDVLARLNDVRARFTVVEQRQEQSSSDLAALTSTVAKAATEAIRDHLRAVVRYEVEQLRPGGGE